MIKKFMSKALLTVFMDKKARKALYAVRTATDMPVVPSKVGAISHTDSKLLDNMDHDEITALIRESLETAKKEEVDEKKKTINNPVVTAISQSRQDLIENALIIFKSKSHIIDDLPADQQKKLKILAFQIFGEQLKGS
jgi:predicted nucleotidyltransferase